MKKALRVTVVIALALLLLALAIPALGTTDQLDSGATVINGEVLASTGTPTETIKMVEDAYLPPPYEIKDFGGSRNIRD